MFSPFGASCFKKEETIAAGNPLNYIVQLSLDDKDPKTNILRNFLSELDNYMCQQVSQNKDWLSVLNVRVRNRKTNKLKTQEEIQEDLENNRYFSLVKDTGDSDYPPLLKTKMSKNNKTGTFETACTIDNQFIDITDDNIEELFHKCLKLKAVILISHIWIVNGRFGLTVKLMIAKLYPSQKFTPIILPESDDDENDDEKSENIEYDDNQSDNVEDIQSVSDSRSVQSYRSNEMDENNALEVQNISK